MDSTIQDERRPQQLDLSKTTVTIGWGEQEVLIPLDAAFAAYTAVQSIGYETTMAAMNFYRKLSGTLGEDVYPGDELRQTQALNQIMQLFAVGAPDRVKEREDLVIGFLYSLLRRNSTGRPSILWDEAAKYATALLNPATPFNADAWRKRTERWIKRKERAGKKVDKVGQRRR